MRAGGAVAHRTARRARGTRGTTTGAGTTTTSPDRLGRRSTSAASGIRDPRSVTNLLDTAVTWRSPCSTIPVRLRGNRPTVADPRPTARAPTCPSSSAASSAAAPVGERRAPAEVVHRRQHRRGPRRHLHGRPPQRRRSRAHHSAAERHPPRRLTAGCSPPRRTSRGQREVLGRFGRGA